ncbi:S1 family peptidase [Aldersonia kunmingensis]|uniref:S1 family peptidase n=1 Tax=Aldersonia kunmingensis TaxID=408066 RepID=UPI000834CAA3|nr:S1 family peptidase [Aldersonia kunmingensis]
MRKWTALRAAVAGSALTLIVGTTVTVSDLASTANAEPNIALPIELVEAIGRDLHMTPEQYLTRAAQAQDLGSYARNFRGTWPNEFSGAWLSPDGTAVIGVTSGTAASGALRDGYQTRMMPISANDLERSVGQLNRQIAELPDSASSQINGVMIDLLNSQIVIDVTNSPTGRQLNLPTVIGNIKVVLTPGGGGPVDPRPMGGDTFLSTRGPLRDTSVTEIGVCSFGFNSVDAHGDALNVSAGHCDPTIAGGNSGGGAGVYIPNLRDVRDSPQVGSFDRASIGDPAHNHLDYSLIKFNNSVAGSPLAGPFIRGGNGTTLTVTGTAEPVIGAPVCKSGQTSAFTCGVIVADHVEAHLFSPEGDPMLIRGFASTACTLAGDSGGALVTGTLALGINSGSNSANATSCPEANISLAPGGGTASLGISIRDILTDIDASSGGGVGAGIRVRTG